MRSLIFFTLLQMTLGRAKQEGEAGGACCRHGGGEKCVLGFWLERMKERNHSEDQGVDGIRMVLGEIGWGCGVDSIDLTDYCDCGDEPYGSEATDLVIFLLRFMGTRGVRCCMLQRRKRSSIRSKHARQEPA
jgi:hypothetical protein